MFGTRSLAQAFRSSPLGPATVSDVSCLVFRRNSRTTRGISLPSVRPAALYFLNTAPFSRLMSTVVPHRVVWVTVRLSTENVNVPPVYHCGWPTS